MGFKACRFERSAKSVRSVMGGALASVLALLAFVICAPQLAFADEAFQTIDGTMTITLQNGASGGGAGGGTGAPTVVTTSATTSGGASSSVLTGDALIWLILGIVVLLAGAVYVIVKSRRLASAGTIASATTGTSDGSMTNTTAGSSSENLTSAKRKTIIVAVITALVACACFGMFASKSNAFAKEYLEGITGTSNVVVDEQGNVLSNDLAINNNSGVAIYINNIQAPDELNGWNASIEDKTVKSGSSTKGTWDGKTIPASLLKQVKNNSSSSIELTLKMSIDKVLDFDKFNVDVNEATYNGGQIKPEVTSDTYKQGTDYEVIYGENKNAGEGTVTIKGIGDYKEEKTYTFAIAPKEVSLFWDDQTSFTYEYDGQSHVPSVSLDGVVRGDTVEVTVDGAQINAGTYTATATIDNANYKLTSDAKTSQDFTIVQREVSLTWSGDSFTYNGQSQAPTAIVENLVEGDQVNLTIKGAQTNAGAYTATVMIDNKNYKLPDDPTHRFVINQIEATLTWTGDTFTYNGEAQIPKASVTNALSGDTVEVTVTTSIGTDAISAGAYNAMPSALSNPNYKLPEDVQYYAFTIERASLVITGLEPVSKAYDGNTIAEVTGEINIEGIIGADDVSVTPGALFNDSGVAENKEVTFYYALKGEKANNYVVDTSRSTMKSKANIYSVLLDIDKFSIDLSNTVYTGAKIKPVVTSTDYVEDVDYVLTYGKNINAGKNEGTITVKGIGNYRGMITKFFTIEQATPEYITPQNLTADTGQSLAEIALPKQTSPVKGSFVWKDPKASVGDVGTNTFLAKFVPEDTNNYKSIDNIEISVVVSGDKGAFAVYFTDGSLGFYHRVDIPKEKDKLDGKTVAQVYTNIENADYQPEWRDKEITSVTVVDSGIQPKSTANWFALTKPESLASVDVSKLNTSKTTTMASMFKGCSTLTTVGDLSNWNTASVTDMSHMFEGCTGLASIGDISDWNTSNVTTMDSTFAGCASLDSLGNLSKWNDNTASVINMTSMFKDCANLTADCSHWTVKGNVQEHTDFDTNAPGVQSPWDEELDFNFFNVNTDAVTYNGSQFKPTVTTTASKYKEGEAYEVIYGENKNAGQGTVTIKGLNKYYGEKIYTFAINQKELTLIWGGETAFVYDGSSHVPIANIYGVVEGDTVNFTVKGEQTNAGTYSALAKIDNENYKLPNEETKSFTITAKELTLSWKDNRHVYDGNTWVPEAELEGVIEGDTVNLTVDGTQTNVGLYTAVVTIDNANYKLPADNTCAFTILRSQVTVSGITANDKRYNRRAYAELTYDNIKLEGKAENDHELSVKASGAFEDVNAGTNKKVNISNITLTGKTVDNYELAPSAHQQKSTTATITPREVAYMWIDLTLTYKGVAQLPTFMINSIIPGDEVEATVTTSDGKDAIDAGGYTAIATAVSNPNYALPQDVEPCEFTIEKAQLCVNNPISAKSKTYDGTTSAEADLSKAEITGIIEGTEVNVSAKGTFEDANVGEDKTVSLAYILSGKDANNYKVKYVASATTTTASITPIYIDEQTISISKEGTTYTGSQLTPEVILESPFLIKGIDYKVFYGENVNAGSDAGSVTIEGISNNCQRAQRKTFDIAQADPSYTAPQDLSGELGQTLADVTLPKQANGTFTWKDSFTSLDKVGTYTFKATFTPTDTKNYKTVGNIEIPVEVTKEKTAFAIYSESDNSLNFYNRVDVPKVGDTFENKKVTALYDKIETENYRDSGAPWKSEAVKTVTVVDRGIQPQSTARWFESAGSTISITSIDVSKLDTSKTTDMMGMFYECAGLSSVGDISQWDTSNVTNMYYMFYDCDILSLDCSGWNVDKVGEAHEGFSEHADGVLSPWDITTYAVYSKDDNSLNFYKRAKVPAVGDTFEGKIVTALYKGMETEIYSQGSDTPWTKDGIILSEVNVVDKDITPVSTAYWFEGYWHLTSVDLSKLDASYVTSMNSMFSDCANLTTVKGLLNWDTSNVTDMCAMFKNCTSLETLAVSKFNTSKVEDMRYMFYNCPKLASLDLSGWDVSSVKSMRRMFCGDSSLASTGDLVGWNTDNVTDMSETFLNCSSLVSIGYVYNWNTDKVTNMSYMFQNCSKLSADCLGWFIGNVPNDKHPNFNENASGVISPWDKPAFVVYCDDDKSLTFYKDKNVPTQGSNYRGKKVSNVYTDIEHVAAGYYTEIPWAGQQGNYKSVTVADYGIIPTSIAWWFSLGTWFDTGSVLNSVDLSKLDTYEVTNMEGLFSGCEKLTTLDLSSFDTSQVENMNYMFWGDKNLERISGTEYWDTSKVTEMRCMFFNLCSIKTINVTGWNTSKVTDMISMFNMAEKDSVLEKIIGIENLDTSSVTVMDSMFSHCDSLKTLPIENWNVSNVRSMERMFEFTWVATDSGQTYDLDLSRWNVSNVRNMEFMFYRASSGGKWNVNVSRWDTSHAMDMYGMFEDSNIVADCSQWDVTNVLDHRKFNESAKYVTPPHWVQ